MERTVFIKSKFMPVRERERQNREQANALWLGKSTPNREEAAYETEYDRSDCIVDGNGLARELENVARKMASEGFEIVSMIPITSGSYTVASAFSGEDTFAYGFSYTEGVLIHAKKS